MSTTANVVTREEAREYEDAHAEGWHTPPDGVPRENCPQCDGRELSSYPSVAELEARQAADAALSSRGLITAALDARRARDEADARYREALVAAVRGRGSRTVAELAEELGLSRPYLHRLARGETT
jgi:hypothetical protein